MTVLIFANGDIPEVEWIRPYLSASSFVIAADGGSRHLLRLDSPPDVLIGDLDSLPSEAQAWRNINGTEVIIYPHDKNETDLELALLYAAHHFKDDIKIFGALGGRLDQTLANIMLLAHPALADRRVELVTEFQRAWLVTEYAEVEGQVGDLISLVPIGGDVLVAETMGLRWPLTNEVLAVGPARGVSNEMTAALAAITITYGTLLCIHTGREWTR
jgi:thiamine pyrophosphokinase